MPIWSGLPLMTRLLPHPVLTLVDAFYRTGSLVFGGGHVVLPLLQAELVPTGWISQDRFLAGYGATQAVPGPLFTFAAFVGAARNGPLGGWLGALICLLAIFLPSFLLLVAALSFWERLRQNPRLQATLAGVNAAVVGLLLSALYQPVSVGTMHQPRDFALALLALVTLMSWLVVAGAALGSWVAA